MPVFDRCEPRTMLPPPITRPTDAPVLNTETTSSASRFTVSKSYPKPLSPAKASPDSFSKTRGYFSSGMRVCSSLVSASEWCPPDLRSQLIPHEPANLDVLARLGRDLFHQIADRLGRVAHPRLVEQRDVLVERLHLPLDDLVDEMVRLALGLYLLGEDAALGIDLFLRDRLLVDGDRVRGGDVLGEVLTELLEILGARHEVRL